MARFGGRPRQRFRRFHRIAFAAVYGNRSVTVNATTENDARKFRDASTRRWIKASSLARVGIQRRDPVNDPSENTFPFGIYGLWGLKGENWRGSSVSLRRILRKAASRRDTRGNERRWARTSRRKITISVVYAIPRDRVALLSEGRFSPFARNTDE